MPISKESSGIPGNILGYIHIYEKKNGDSYLQQLLEKAESPRKEKTRKKKNSQRTLEVLLGRGERKKKEHQPGKERTPTFPASPLRRRKVPFFFKHTQEYIQDERKSNENNKLLPRVEK
jgi:hypothetical protein